MKRFDEAVSPVRRTTGEACNASAVCAGPERVRAGGLCGLLAARSWCFTWLGLLLFTGAGFLLWHLHAHGLAVRMIAVERLADAAPRRFDPQEATRVAQEFSARDPVALLREVMNGVPRVGPDPRGGITQFREHVKAGEGLVCFGMAHLYAAAAHGNGLQSRIVGLSRNLGDRYDAHTTVEVRQGGRWVLFDPTFNVSFRRNGVLLGAEDIQRALLEGTHQSIVPVFYGPVKYPARLETYYMHWLSLFNNVFVLDVGGTGLAKLPPLRYWFGPRIFVQTSPGHPNEHIRFWDGLYLWSTAILPLLGLACLTLGGLGLFLRRRTSRLDVSIPAGCGPPAVR